MAREHRLDEIIRVIDEHGYLSVSELSKILQVSEMTIRRDLTELDSEKRIHRTYGGAATYRTEEILTETLPEAGFEENLEVTQLDQVDVLIATVVDPSYDNLLLDRVGKKNIPIIAESIEMPGQRTLVAIDNYLASRDLGRWAGQYLTRRGVEKAYLLDLTFHLTNTQNRSRGFVDGLHETCPSAEVVLSISSQSRYASSYRLTCDALAVYPHINLIFAINDTTAQGAINACRDLHIDPENMTVVTFGLEGAALINELMAGSYCKAGLAMFPEIVSLTCIEAAIAAYNQQPLPPKYVTPHIVLTPQTLPLYYTFQGTHWNLNWETVKRELAIPIQIERDKPAPSAPMPHMIGLIIPFLEHEWYKNLGGMLKAYASQYGIGLQMIDAGQNMRDEVELRRQEIAKKAVSLIEPGDVVLVDGGTIAVYLATELKKKKEITIITNSVTVFDILNHTSGITLISTGGVVRDSTQMLVGPTAERALKELRADKLFLMVSGITLDFGLSHNAISEVTIKQAMIRSSREVILLADHTAFGAEAGIQVAPLSIVRRLITDDALPPSTRLEISKKGIQILLV
jgi:DeoR/GlpR family transcriptional regulator of sugar metabolism